MGKPRSPPIQAKPRDRAGDLGRAFDKLRDTLPTYQSGRKKLTKIETLKLAAIYISDLAGLLDQVQKDPSNLDSPDVRLQSRKRRTSASSSASTPSRTGSVSSISSSQQSPGDVSPAGHQTTAAANHPLSVRKAFTPLFCSISMRKDQDRAALLSCAWCTTCSRHPLNILKSDYILGSDTTASI